MSGVGPDNLNEMAWYRDKDNNKTKMQVNIAGLGFQIKVKRKDAALSTPYQEERRELIPRSSVSSSRFEVGGGKSGWVLLGTPRTTLQHGYRTGYHCCAVGRRLLFIGGGGWALIVIRSFSCCRGARGTRFRRGWRFGGLLDTPLVTDARRNGSARGSRRGGCVATRRLKQ